MMGSGSFQIGRRGLILGAAAAAGCTGGEDGRHQELRPGYRFDPTRGDAVVLGSLEVLGAKGRTARTEERWLTAIVRRRADQAPPGPDSGPFFRVIPGSGTSFDATGTETEGTSFVTFFVLVVPAGHYTVSWLDVEGEGRSVTSRMAPLGFMMGGNELRYVGNLFFRYDAAFQVQEMAMRNRAERDLPRLAGAAPWVPRDRIAVDIATAPGWRSERTA